MKLLITMGILIFSTIGGWLGAIVGHGWLSAWSIILSTVGAFAGIWAGYVVGKNYF
jgi:hypothetical protein